ncbi:putative short-chain dehydrogenases/reductase [Fomitopsis serialis]|uniref:putative short-chain dehydrogenases/reductase n=1 Tax=Fomitopsis serialis TaxID=139415 RepID=UPI002007D5EA|nr:putative short-chain dehydrogenases/reductase [Neoantrodia serialis]KAH9935618.1 putative short-chain dehydrogenases/reductase [Neoantrodia serialis]
MPSYLVTGANRGLGLAMVKELLKDPQNLVVGTARNPGQCETLVALAKEHPSDRFATISLDLSSKHTMDKAAEVTEALLPDGLDYLVSNAAVCHQNVTPFDQIDVNVLEEELCVNAAAPLYLLQKFLPLIRRGAEKKVMLVSSCLGSLEIAPMFVGCSDSYSLTKAALNMLGRKWGALLKEEGVTVVVVHPGWVDTDMGGHVEDWIAQHAPSTRKLPPAESAEGCLKIFRVAKLENAVEYYAWDGTKLPW